MNIDQTLSTVLLALRQNIEPALQGDRARASLQSIVHVLTHLAVNHAAPQPDSRDDAARIATLLGDAPEPVALPAHAGPDDPSIPWDYFGDATTYAQMEARLAGLIATGDDAPTLQALLAWERRALDRIAERTQALEPERSEAPADNAAADALEARRAAFERYLRARFPADGALRVTELRPFAGGRSKFTGLARVEGCAALPPAFVLRQDATINTTGGPSVVSEYALLDRLHALGIKVARPYLLERDAGALGTPFVLMEQLRGSLASGLLTPPYSAAVTLDVARTLARLHAIPLARLDGAVADTRAPSRAELLAELDGFAQPWFTLDRPPCLAIRYALDWLRANIDLGTEGNAALIHRDTLFHNVLAEGDELTGIVDWEFARVGYPAEDLGWMRAVVEGTVPWQDFVDAYAAAGGPALGAAQLDFYAVWGAVRLCSMMVQANWMASTGVLHDVEYTCVAFHDTYVARRWLAMHVARVLPR